MKADTALPPPGIDLYGSGDNKSFKLIRARITKNIVYPLGSRKDSLEELLVEDQRPQAIAVISSDNELFAVWLSYPFNHKYSSTQLTDLSGSRVPIVFNLHDMLDLHSVKVESDYSYLTNDMLFVTGPVSTEVHTRIDAHTSRGREWTRRLAFIASRVSNAEHQMAAVASAAVIMSIFLAVPLRNESFGLWIGLIPMVLAAIVTFSTLSTVFDVIRLAAIRELSMDSIREAVFYKVPVSYVLIPTVMTFPLLAMPAWNIRGVLAGVVVWFVYDSFPFSRWFTRGRPINGLAVYAKDTNPLLGDRWDSENRGLQVWDWCVKIDTSNKIKR